MNRDIGVRRAQVAHGDKPPSGKKREFRFHPIKETVVEEPVDVTPYLDQLDESLRDKVLQLQKGRWVQTLLPALGPGTSYYLDGVQVSGGGGALEAS